MYLYQLAFKEYIDSISQIREVILLQHEKDYEEVEFENIVNNYYAQGISEFKILDVLKEKEGFRIFPKVIYKKIDFIKELS